MILWTIQPFNVYGSLQHHGILYVDPALREDQSPYWERPYRWMMAQMKQRIPGYAGHYPWWAWQKYLPDRARPDLRTVRTWCRGPHVLMKLDVPDDEVLLSDYDAWHAVLNRMPITDTEAEYDELWKRLSRPDENFEPLLQAGWERIFDLEGWKGHWMYAEEPIVQACFETLRLENVKSARYFEGIAPERNTPKS